MGNIRYRTVQVFFARCIGHQPALVQHPLDPAVFVLQTYFHFHVGAALELLNKFCTDQFPILRMDQIDQSSAEFILDFSDIIARQLSGAAVHFPQCKIAVIAASVNRIRKGIHLQSGRHPLSVFHSASHD